MLEIGRYGAGVQLGGTALLRYVENGRVVGALPTRVAADGADAVALYLAEGTRAKWAYVDGNPIRQVSLEQRFTSEWHAGDHHWRDAHVLMLKPANRSFAIWHFFSRDWDFEGWYVNLETPYRRTATGFDTRDHTLDIVVEPDGSWRWKDEDELELAIEHGHHPPSEAAAIRAEGERVLADWPFPTGWESWRPDSSWSVPELPDDWHVL
jgi:phosphatidylserine/phosphatidylglycerophosphate/cardiolipin synthase-like enzyme